MILSMDLGVDSYHIVIERGIIHRADQYFNLNRKVLIVTDSGVPTEYAAAVAKCCAEPYVETFPQGEQNKNMATYQTLLLRMVREGFSRRDCVVAVGGGVAGDMAGFAAASYMRGIDFYNVPTTLLAQVDSSIGGKVAIDFEGYKNIVGAFHQPKGVLIDPDTLKTLPQRQIANGLAEAIKMAATSNEKLFSLMENSNPTEKMEEIIEGSLKIKKSVVEQDPKEQGLRRVLNFGHTVGHAIETVSGLSELYHGECVGLGMLVMAADKPRKRISALLEKVGLPTAYTYEKEKVIAAMAMDKKVSGNGITVVDLPEIGRFELNKISLFDLKKRMEEAL